MRKHNLPPALKHGAYSGMSILPGEDSAAFEKLRANLFVDLSITGPMEEDILNSIARYVWRKQNLTIYAVAEHAQFRFREIQHQVNLNSFIGHEEKNAAAEDQAQAELGSSWKFVETSRTTTISYLNQELSVSDRLDGMIDRCLKRLLLLRGVKSLSVSPPAAAEHPVIQRKRHSGT